MAGEEQESIDVYCCRFCRRVLFDDDNLTSHQRSVHLIKSWKLAKDNVNPANPSSHSSEIPVNRNMNCTSYFLEDPTKWMLASSEYKMRRKKRGEAIDYSSEEYVNASIANSKIFDEQGNINCPNEKCKKRVGQFKWSGSQCSCGTWVVPAIQVTKSKVDKRTIKRDKLPSDSLPIDD